MDNRDYVWNFMSKMICGNGCYSGCWKHSTSTEWKNGAVAGLCANTAYTGANVCDGIDGSQTACQKDACCGVATEYHDGKCVPTYTAMEKACKFGHTEGLEWFCKPLVDASCDDKETQP